MEGGGVTTYAIFLWVKGDSGRKNKAKYSLHLLSTGCCRVTRSSVRVTLSIDVWNGF